MREKPVFLTTAQIQQLHTKVIQLFGGAVGIRDMLLFEAAVIHSTASLSLYKCRPL